MPYKVFWKYIIIGFVVIGSTFMPMVFGQIQQAVGIGIMPLYLLIFAALNIGLLELAYRRINNRVTEK